jgi:fructose-1,6-bisphosphatase/inositol monophosphatase family enzyme
LAHHNELYRIHSDSIPISLLHLVEDAGYTAASLFDAGSFKTLRKSDGSLQTTVDTALEGLIVNMLQNVALPAPILTEEDASSTCIDLDAKIPFFWSVDPIDGTSRLGAGFERGWSVSVGAVVNGVPAIGIVTLPKAGLLYATENVGGVCAKRVENHNPYSLLGLSLGVSLSKNEHLWEFNRRLIEEFGSILSEPSVQSGIDFLTGRTKLFVACNSSHWDLCAITALALEQGAIVQHCNGIAIDWAPRREKFAPVVFARSKDDAQRVSKLYFSSYEYVHPRNK